MSQLTVKSDRDAFRIAEALIVAGPDGTIPKFSLDGWPIFEVRVVGAGFNQSINTSIMKGLIELQNAIYRTYAILRYNTYNARVLTHEDRALLELHVRVEDGSSKYKINFQELLERIVDLVGDKLTGRQIMALILAGGLIYASNSSISHYLDTRKEIRLAEIHSEEDRQLIHTLDNVVRNQTEQMQIIAGLVDIDPDRLKPISQIATDAHTEFIRRLPSGDVTSTVQGIELPGYLKAALMKNARRSSVYVTLESQYRIFKVDSSNPFGFVISVRDEDTGEVINGVEAKNEVLTSSVKQLLQNAEWSKGLVTLRIKARIVGDKTTKAELITAN